MAVNIARFVGLEDVPPGFHVDELGGAVTIQCLVTEGRDAKGEARLPLLFSDLKFGTPKPPTYIYPAMAWTSVFGFSIASFRGFIAFVVVLTIAGLFLLGRLLAGTPYAAVVALIASVSPWAWMFSRIAYEPMLGPCFMVWGLYVFFRFKNAWSYALAGLCFAAAMYSYPPMRLQIPLMMASLMVFDLLRKELKIGRAAAMIVTAGLASAPLIYYILTKDLQSRFAYIGITSKEYLASIGKTGSLPDLLSIFIQNFFLHFTPSFLFFKGSVNAMHTTGRFGILSWSEAFAVIAGCAWLVLCLVRPKCRPAFKSDTPQYLLLFFLNVLICVVPAALTWEGVPHALRTVTAWPFVALLTSYVLWKLMGRSDIFLPLICMLTAVFVLKFGQYYFTDYRTYTYGMYSPWSKEEAMAAKTELDWLNFIARHRHQDYHTCYYLMNYNGDSCSQARYKWEQVNNALR